MSDEPPIEVEPSTGTKLVHDSRPPMAQPPLVRLIAVADVHLPAAVGREAELDAFYVHVLGFGRDETAPLAFRAENLDLVFDVLEAPVDRDGLVPTMVEVPSLSGLRDALVAREIEFEAIRGLIPGHYHFALQDPAGNWLNIAEWRVVR